MIGLILGLLITNIILTEMNITATDTSYNSQNKFNVVGNGFRSIGFCVKESGKYTLYEKYPNTDYSNYQNSTFYSGTLLVRVFTRIENNIDQMQNFLYGTDSRFNATGCKFCL